MTPFAPVRRIEDLDTLDENDIFEGYQSAERGDPEPGENRGRGYWHGWRAKMMDLGEIPIDDDHRVLTVQVVARAAKERAARNAGRK